MPPEQPFFDFLHPVAVAAASTLAALFAAPEGFEDDYGFHPSGLSWEPAEPATGSPADGSSVI